MPIVTANKIEMSYVESGTGEPLILIHGTQSDRRQFDVFRPLLGDGIRAIAYDQRDAPDHPYVDGAYTMRDHADDCAAFIAALGLRRAHLMGTSYGGAVAMQTALHHPRCVQSLILAATTPSWGMTEPIALGGTNERDPGAVERFMLGMLITPEAIDSDPVLAAEARAAVRPRHPDMLDRRIGAMQEHDCSNDLGRIQAPTLVLHGEDDPLITAKTAAWTAGQIPGAQLMLLPGSRHGLTFQHRQRTADAVRAFVLTNAHSQLTSGSPD